MTVAAREKGRDLLVMRLREVDVELAHGVKVGRGVNEYQHVSFALETGADALRSNGDGEDQLLGPALADGMERSGDRGSRGHAVVDEDDDLAGQWQKATTREIKTGALIEGAAGFGGDFCDLFPCEASTADHGPVEGLAVSGDDCTEGELFVARHPEFPAEEDVEGCVERSGDLGGYEDSPTGYAEDNGVGSVGVVCEVPG
ncbi:MAG TPA: hypothetical protein VM865_05560 [Acidobacteriaceae bacterium]|jgi:hypothetical protein|nr:hypothetical protein [Acidobacteriaceae bacterium]